ncbi:hypothetical protein Tdes44962_MAKER03885 [Teratosphaeria destructans]|uniref:Nudix hydrolase domain-containing protein n=1 Tax=Teratosphaeria destructans TaxID=418781 RepID=A0A9W7SNQ0_9PEZI|nr:hypothetical protein Tdes44962_MAKER03885 [Teratosphaeria destructans]
MYHDSTSTVAYRSSGALSTPSMRATSLLIAATAAIGTAQAAIGGLSGLHTDIPRWCGKAYESAYSSFDPGGQLYAPDPSRDLLLNLQLVTRHSIYDSSERAGAFIVDARLSYIHGSLYTRPFSAHAGLSYAHNSTYTSPTATEYLSNVTHHFAQLEIEIRVAATNQLLVMGAIPVGSSNNILEFDLNDFTPRREPYEVVLYGRTASDHANWSYTASTELYYLPAKYNGSTVKIDNLHGGMLVANHATGYAFEPLVPFGFYTSCSGYLNHSLANVAAYKNLGFNAINPVCSLEDGDLGYLFDWLDGEQLWYQYDMRNSYLNLTAVAEQIPLIKDRSSLLSWFTAHEPDGIQTALNGTRLAYDLLKREDPYHPTGLVLNCANYYFEEYTSGTDYIMQDAYPVGINATFSKWNTICNATYGCCGCDDCLGELRVRTFFLCSSIGYAESAETILTIHFPMPGLGNWQKPLWSVLQVFDGEGHWSREPTPEETWVMMVLSFNHKAKAIMSWIFPASEMHELAHGKMAKVASTGLVSHFLLAADPVQIAIPGRPLLDVSYWQVGDKVMVGLANLEYIGINSTVSVHLPMHIRRIESQPWGNLSWSFEDGVIVIQGLSALSTSFVVIHVGNQPVNVGVGVFVFQSHDDNHFVIGRRKGSSGAGTYALPGGHLEHGESFEDCAIREVKEETGLDVDDVRFLTAVNSVFSETGKHYVTVFMTAMARDRGSMPQLLEPEKCDGWSWSTFDELRAMPGRGHELFLPMHSLMQQRPAICDKLERGPTALSPT